MVNYPILSVTRIKLNDMRKYFLYACLLFAGVFTACDNDDSDGIDPSIPFYQNLGVEYNVTQNHTHIGANFNKYNSEGANLRLPAKGILFNGKVPDFLGMGAYIILKKSGDFNLLFDICSRAASIYPYDEEIQMFKISCLVDMERFLDAKEAYDEVAKRFFEDLGISPSNNMKELYNKRLGNIQLTISDVAKIKELIKEKDNTKGAYYCNYLGFIDSYRFIARVVERSGQSIYLSLFTLTDTKGKPLETGEKLTEAVKSLHSVIANSLRRGDLYTRYSQNQFLVLLVGINYENCSVVSNRIFSNFDELKIRGIRLSAASISGTDVEQPKNKEPLKFLNTAKWQ